jgi:hypothetical protein
MYVIAKFSAAQDQRAAASLLGVVLAKRPSIADFLVAEGALKAAVQLLLKGGSRADAPRHGPCNRRTLMLRAACLNASSNRVWHTHRQAGRCTAAHAGDKQTADVAVAAVWGLVKGNQKLLRPEADALGASGTALAGPLLDVVLRGKVTAGL